MLSRAGAAERGKLSKSLVGSDRGGKPRQVQLIVAGVGLVGAPGPLNGPLLGVSPGHNEPDARTIAPRHSGFNQHKR